ncbi:RNA-binding protein [Schizosaccharomyces japonicus yFS275]|uniref:RNA-binding protein n=1 Tax=Schizosaccharomyces japonicus (strain yFS275 / FY16936) TaxID=402676 RepID=B6JZP1_SCHJY|nr:RNA-binding protein [Schizosaccharomyces japonicus yFS275]EEB07009.2 RNA-binding protein [Schizosaccharomyces japonicus yFS275]
MSNSSRPRRSWDSREPRGSAAGDYDRNDGRRLRSRRFDNSDREEYERTRERSQGRTRDRGFEENFDYRDVRGRNRERSPRRDSSRDATTRRTRSRSMDRSQVRRDDTDSTASPAASIDQAAVAAAALAARKVAESIQKQKLMEAQQTGASPESTAHGSAAPVAGSGAVNAPATIPPPPPGPSDASPRPGAGTIASSNISRLPSPPPPPPPPPSIHSIISKVIESDGVFLQDVEINDVRNRYILVKENTISDIQSKTGVQLFTRGKYYPNKALATAKVPPLHMHVVAKTREQLQAAINEIDKWINKDVGPLVDERRFRHDDNHHHRPSPTGSNATPLSSAAGPSAGAGSSSDDHGRRRWLEDKVFVNLTPSRGFHLRQAIVGPQGAYVKHIQQETHTRVQIKGHGSGFIESSTNRESDEPLHLHILGQDAASLQRARSLCEDLIANVHQQFKAWKNAPRERGGHNHNHNSNHSTRQPVSSSTPYASNNPAATAAAGTLPAAAAPMSAAAAAPLPSMPADAASLGMAAPGTKMNLMPAVPMPAISAAPGTTAPGLTPSGVAVPGMDPYAAYGGYQAYMQFYQQQLYAQYQNMNAGNNQNPQ